MEKPNEVRIEPTNEANLLGAPVPESVADANTAAPPLVANIELKAVVLLVLLIGLVCAALGYVLYARGMFEKTQQLVLLSDDSEGVIAGMDLTFSGFAVGRVRKIELADDGKVRIVIDLAQKDAKWIRTSSVFTMERGLVGDTKLRVFTGILSDPPLPPNSVRTVLRGDVTAELPRLLNTVHDLMRNLESITHADSNLNQSLANVQSITKGVQGRYGLLGSILGGDAHAKKIVEAIDQVNLLLKKTDQRLYGKQGLADQSQASIAQLNALLLDARSSMQKVDAVLAEAQAVGKNARIATTDLGLMREQVEANLRKVENLINEVNRKWPFSRETEVTLP